MVRKKIQCIVLCMENRIELDKEGRGIFSSECILESGPYFRRGFIGCKEDEPLRLYGLDEVCRCILVAIDEVVGVVSFKGVHRFFTYNNIPTVKRFENILRDVSPSMVVFGPNTLWDRA